MVSVMTDSCCFSFSSISISYHFIFSVFLLMMMMMMMIVDLYSALRIRRAPLLRYMSRWKGMSSVMIENIWWWAMDCSRLFTMFLL